MRLLEKASLNLADLYLIRRFEFIHQLLVFFKLLLDDFTCLHHEDSRRGGKCKSASDGIEVLAKEFLRVLV